MSFVKVVALIIICSIIWFNASIAQDTVSDFEGHWSWGLYADDKNELPPAYRNMPLSKVPEYSLELDIKQQKNKISGHYISTWRFLSKIEEGDFTSIVKGNETYLNLESGFGGEVRVKLVKDNNSLLWEVIKRTGEDFFHKKVTLSKKKR